MSESNIGFGIGFSLGFQNNFSCRLVLAFGTF